MRRVKSIVQTSRGPDADLDHSNRDLKIAIVGAGMAGIAAARALRKLDYRQVVVFEKESEVGGKIQSISTGDSFCELGAVVANHDFKTILRLAKAEDQPISQTRECYATDSQGQSCSYRQFVCRRYGLLKFLGSSYRFWQTSQRYPELQKPGLARVNPELFLPMQAFAKLHRIEAATDSMRSFLCGCGYGYYEDIPALYLMKLAPWVLKQSFKNACSCGLSRNWSTFDHGWQELCRRLVKPLNVYVNAPVTGIHRRMEQKKPLIELTVGGEKKLFDRLILATPLDLALSYLDCKTIEQELFSRIQYVRYLTTIIEGERLFTTGFVDHVTQESLGCINFIIQAQPHRNFYHLYQMLDKKTSHTQALQQAQQEILSLGGRISKTIAQKEWRYFPHVGCQDLSDGFYERLENLQGLDGTFYLGGLLSFETVEHTAAYAEDLIQRFFIPHEKEA